MHDNMALLDVKQRYQQLVSWNATCGIYPLDDTAALAFEKQAHETPGKVAVVCGNRKLTYAQLNAQANVLAHHLRALQVGPDVLVGICVERSVQMVVAVLSVLKAGGAYVPLDPGYPVERLAHMIDDAQVAVLLAQRGASQIFSRYEQVTVYIDEIEDLMASHPPENPSNVTDSANLAYVIYTSGSTGKPKGVAISNRSLLNLVAAMKAAPGINSTDIILCVSPLSFDLATMDMFVALTCGATVVIAPTKTTRDPQLLAEEIERRQVTVMQATPATWRMLLDINWMGGQNLKVMCGAEAMRPDLINFLLPRCASLWNMYGPTETTVWSTIWVVKADMPLYAGHPIANTQAYILDKDLQLLPVGATGDLYLAGDGLARGYWNKNLLTAEKFIPNPFSSEGGRRMYNTGDLARYTPDGTIECLGRSDHQIKIRGFRIEPGEIEAALLRLPAIRNAVVVAAKDSINNQRLVAYIVCFDKIGAPGEAQLRKHLSLSLPSYMVPAQFVVLDRIPLTASGKTDQRALPAPEEVAAYLKQPLRPLETSFPRYP